MPRPAPDLPECVGAPSTPAGFDLVSVGRAWSLMCEALGQVWRSKCEAWGQVWRSKCEKGHRERHPPAGDVDTVHVALRYTLPCY